MDILARAKEQHPEMFREEEKPTWQAPEGDYGFLMRLVMRFSWGRIRDVNAASYALLGVACVIAVLSFLFWFGLPGSSSETVPLLRSAHPDIIGQ